MSVNMVIWIWRADVDTAPVSSWHNMCIDLGLSVVLCSNVDGCLLAFVDKEVSNNCEWNVLIIVIAKSWQHLKS